MRTVPVAFGLLLIAGSCGSAVADGIFQNVSLSPETQSRLVVHFDGRRGVTVSGGGVVSWAGLDGNGAQVALATVGGAGPAANISHTGAGTILFTEWTASDDLHLQAQLTHAGGGSWTIFFAGRFDSTNDNFAQNSGIYAYNLTDAPNAGNGLNLQRDDGGGGFVAEIYTNTTVGYGSITQYDDEFTVFRSVHTASPLLSTLHANREIVGAPRPTGWNIGENPTLILGAFDDGTTFDGSGYSLLGEIAEVLVFDGTICASDIKRLEEWLGSGGAPQCAGDANGDSIVNFEDLNLILAAYGAQAGSDAYRPSVDLDANCAVDFGDLNEALGSFGQSCE